MNSYDWAPLFNVPIERRIQTAAVTFALSLIPLCFISFLLLFWFQTLIPLLLGYLVFIYVDTAPERGTRFSLFWRELSVWKWAASYFPIRLRKMEDLDPNKTYVMGYAPHGIISVGAFYAFATEAAGFSKLFPGITPHLLTLESNFRSLPLWRDLLLFLGIGSVSKRSCLNILKSGKGQAIMIVPGGASESLYAFPGKYDLVLRRRKGFIKVALETGSSLVPVLGFGETDVWNQLPNPEGSRVRSFQKGLQSILHFTMPLFYGRGIFTYNGGILPHRRPITCVTGKPIDCPKVEKPPTELIEEYQEKYIAGLQSLWDTFKDELAPDRKDELLIVE